MHTLRECSSVERKTVGFLHELQKDADMGEERRNFISDIDRKRRNVMAMTCRSGAAECTGCMHCITGEEILDDYYEEDDSLDG